MKRTYAWLLITLILGLCVVVAFLSFQINNLKELNVQVSSQFDEQNLYKESLLIDIKALESENQQLKASLEQINESTQEDKEIMGHYYKILSGDLEINNDPENLMYYPWQEFDGNYKVDSTLSSFEYIKLYLDSFRKLTDTVSKTLSDEQQLSIGNLSWDVQTLGFYNHSNRVLVGIRELNYIIKKLNYELSIKKFELKEITIDELNKQTDDYIKYKDEFIEFAKGVNFVD